MNSTEIAALHHQPLHERNELVALARRHAGGRLIHQQQPRLVGERNGQFDALDVAIGEFAAGTIGGVAHADLRKKFKRAIAVQIARRTPEIVGLARVRDQRHLHIFGDRHRAECSGDLEGAADAEPPDLAWLAPGNVAAFKENLRRNPAPAGR